MTSLELNFILTCQNGYLAQTKAKTERIEKKMGIFLKNYIYFSNIFHKNMRILIQSKIPTMLNFDFLHFERAVHLVAGHYINLCCPV